jgi:hypothetical protein
MGGPPSTGGATETLSTAGLLAALADPDPDEHGVVGPLAGTAGRLSAPGGERQVASLWAGYGRVTELTVVVAEGG